MRLDRRILHVDMDAFFAAVELLDHPELRGLPVIVGGTPEGRGVVATASYEARRFGVRSAMPAATAVRLCPDGVFVRPRMERYVEVSRQVFAIFREYTPRVEPISIDEAFLDVTGARPVRSSLGAGEDPARAIARELAVRVRDETGGLTCSIGVAPNKFLAKVASDLRKPAAIVFVPTAAEDRAAFLAPLPVRKLWGVGPKSAERLAAIGITRIGELARLSERHLRQLFGDDQGRHFARLAVGSDDRPVVVEREARSVSQERTYAEFIRPDDRDRIERELFSMAERVARRLQRAGLWTRSVQLKVRDERFVTHSRSSVLAAPTATVEEIYRVALSLLDERVEMGSRRVRLLGVGAHKLVKEPVRQLELFEACAGSELAQARASEALARAAETVRAKLGENSIVRARLLADPEAKDDE